MYILFTWLARPSQQLLLIIKNRLENLGIDLLLKSYLKVYRNTRNIAPDIFLEPGSYQNRKLLAPEVKVAS